ncbi:MAG: hypothetical protein DMG14_00835 [Acidobacteria bacterium]|nr:MAG: hypothetical protein DMG14_00835 [Acidobacteriota bacterium]
MFGLKQPVLGIAAAILVMTVSLGFISFFDFPTFGSWVAYLMICIIPMQIVIGVTWGTNQPAFAAKQKQPVKGILLAALTLLAGVVVAPTYLAVSGGNITPPGPVPSHAIIVSVVVTFWATIVFGAWPFKTLFKNDVVAGVAMLVACYVVNLLLFRLFFDYTFLQGAPVYVASLDPHGMFTALNALVFYVTSLSIMFLLLSFDLWPLTKFHAVMQQPVLGIVWTAVCVLLGGLLFWIGMRVVQMDVMVFLVTVPIPYIFGSIIVLNMLQNSAMAKLTQPVKGIANALLVAVIGTGLAQLYRGLAPVVTGTLHSGPPTYELEIWLASALLAVTFPFLIFFAEFFKFWPLAKSE